MSKYIYVIASLPGTIKIGVATDPKQRLRELQTGSPIKLVLFDAIQVPKGLAFTLETAVHRRLARHALEGEWLLYPPEQAVRVILETISGPATREQLDDYRAARAFPRRLLRLVCPHCRHFSQTNLTKDEIWARRFRCKACNASIDGRRFFVRIAV
jgi:hypothetical protein